jgi:hypothetical protein
LVRSSRGDRGVEQALARLSSAVTFGSTLRAAGVNSAGCCQACITSSRADRRKPLCGDVATVDHEQQVSPGGENLVEVIVTLRRVAVLLDQFWNESLDSDRCRMSMRLGDASHSVHRALIALEEAHRQDGGPITSSGAQR